MKYLIQFMIIMTFVFLGEGLAYLIPFPIAGSIYGMILLFLALLLGAVKISWIVNVADCLLGVMSLFFVAPAVAIISIWPGRYDCTFISCDICNDCDCC